MKKNAGLLIINFLSILGIVISLFFKKTIIVGPESQLCTITTVAPIFLLINIIATFIYLILDYHCLLKEKNTKEISNDSKSDNIFILYLLNSINLFSVICMIIFFWLYRI